VTKSITKKAHHLLVPVYISSTVNV